MTSFIDDPLWAKYKSAYGGLGMELKLTQWTGEKRNLISSRITHSKSNVTEI
jgi:hypothetical protein